MWYKPSFFSAIATSVMVLAIAPLYALDLSQTSRSINQPIEKISQLPQSSALIYVSPSPNPTGDGSVNNPYPSITAAIASKPMAGSVIQLQEGIYSAETGESFPFKIPTGVILRGEPTARGVNTVIRGGGKFISATFASQNITMLLNNDARVEGITVTNPNTRGTAIWVESGQRVTIANNTLINSDREGVFLAGTADAIISDNVFRKNGANGLSAVGSSTGEIRNNVFEGTGFGLAIGQKSRVNVSDNQILNNVDGVIISNLSSPTLRNNLIADNKRNGIAILKDRKGYPIANLGTSTSLGKNVFRNNLGKDINNNSGVTQVAVGNELDLKKVVGDVAFTGEVPIASSPVVASTNVPVNLPIEIKREITRSPESSFNPPITPPTALAPSSKSIFLEPLPDVPQVSSSSNALNSNPTSSAIATKPATPSQISNEILIDRDPVPVALPNASPSPSVPSKTANIMADASPATTPPPIAATTIPFNAKIAALVPPPARETAPYLVIVPSSDAITLDRVRSVVPTAKFIVSRFGHIVMVQGYPDRDRAEVLKVIIRSAIGLDARVIHQNSL